MTAKRRKLSKPGEGVGRPDWRERTLARVRELIRKADPDAAEEIKWRKPSNGMRGVPVWSHDGLICTGETYKSVVKLTFAKGASLADPAGLFNAGLGGGTRRAIDLREGERLDGRAFTALIRAAVALNTGGTRRAAPRSPSRDHGTRLLSGGNPRIAKAEGETPVRAYIDAMPEWKRAVGLRLDALVARNVPGVRRAVKWNSPFYGVEGRGWFMAFHVFARYVKVTFFRGTSLRPPPPGGRSKEARWIDIHEDDLDEARLARWIRQAARLPGWSGSGRA